MKRRIFALGIMAMLMIAMFPTVAFAESSPWSGASDTSWYSAGDTSFSLMTAEQLAGLAQLVNGGNDFSGKTVTLDDDIDLADRQWTPIGIDNAHPFNGTFDGGGYAVTGLAIGTSGSPSTIDLAGLFGHAESGSLIENLSVQGIVNISGNNSAGVLAGLMEGDMDNCHVSGSVTSGTNSGGLAGRAYGSITDSHSDADITGGSDSGGLVGNYEPDSDTDTLSGCYASGSVSVSDNYAGGGLLGYFNNEIDITDCYATGDVNTGADGYAGGFLGCNWNGNAITISDCFSTGDVTSGSGSCTGGFAGGLVDDTCTLERCFAAGDVMGGAYTGGLLGYSDIVIKDCYASGSVGGATDAVGGLIGLNAYMVQTSYVRGAVTGGAASSVGGLIGENYFNVTGCYFDTRGTGQTGAIGSGTAATVTALDTTEMTGTGASGNMTDFAFSTAWLTKTNDSKWYYPQLKVFAQSSDPAVRAASLASVTMTPFTVTFDVDGGSAVDSEYGYYTAVGEPDDPTWDGHAFGGWYTDDGFTTAYDFSALVTADITLYAKWTPYTYTVQYDANGGSGTTASSAHTYDVAKTLTANGFSREYYAFAGWAESAAGAVEYSDGQSVKNLTAVNGATVTLYAKWTAQPELTSTDDDGTVYTGGRFTLTPNIDGGEWDWDHSFFSATFNSPATFTALKAGESTITYTVDGVSASYDVTIEESALPSTGQDFTWVWGMCAAAVVVLCSAVWAVLHRRKKLIR